MEDDDAWRGFEIALGSRSGTRVMRHYPHASSFDTLLSPSDYGRRRFPTLASPCCEVPVTMQRLDAVVDDAVEPGTGRSILLKVDTQGFDLEVLRGAERCLHRIAALQLELPALPIYEGLPTFGVTIEEIMTLGFDPIGFFPESRTENLRVVEFNALFGSRR
jgi:FkbM family methyltransferase